MLKMMCYVSSHFDVHAVCGYGQPYNSTSSSCYVSGPSSPAPDASIMTCPRGSAFDTFEQQCVYVGDLPTPTFPSTSTVWCSPNHASLTRNLAGPKPYTCRGPPVIAPPSAIVVGTGTGQGSLVKLVQGVPGYPTVAAVTGATTVSVSDGTITATKSLGGMSSYSIPPTLDPIFGNYSTGQLNPDSTFTIVPTTIPGTALYGSIGTLDCAALSSMMSAMDLAMNNPELFAACVDALQYGCPTASQLDFWSMIESPAQLTTNSPSPSPSPAVMPEDGSTDSGSSASPTMPKKGSLAAMWAGTQHVVNKSEHKIVAFFG